MSNLYRELDLSVDDTPVMPPRPAMVPAESGRRRFDKWGSIPERRFRETIGHRAASYGITEERFWEMFKEQDGGCAICSAEFSPTGRPAGQPVRREGRGALPR